MTFTTEYKERFVVTTSADRYDLNIKNLLEATSWQGEL